MAATRGATRGARGLRGAIQREAKSALGNQVMKTPEEIAKMTGRFGWLERMGARRANSRLVATTTENPTWWQTARNAATGIRQGPWAKKVPGLPLALGGGIAGGVLSSVGDARYEAAQAGKMENMFNRQDLMLQDADRMLSSNSYIPWSTFDYSQRNSNGPMSNGGGGGGFTGIYGTGNFDMGRYGR